MTLQTVAEVIEFLENKWELVANEFEHVYAMWRESSLDFDIAQHLYGHKLELKYRKMMMLEIGWWREDAFDSVTFKRTLWDVTELMILIVHIFLKTFQKRNCQQLWRN